MAVDLEPEEHPVRYTSHPCGPSIGLQMRNQDTNKRLKHVIIDWRTHLDEMQTEGPIYSLLCRRANVNGPRLHKTMLFLICARRQGLMWYRSEYAHGLKVCALR